MPKVGKKKFPYTKEGKTMAKKEMEKMHKGMSSKKAAAKKKRS